MWNSRSGFTPAQRMQAYAAGFGMLLSGIAIPSTARGQNASFSFSGVLYGTDRYGLFGKANGELSFVRFSAGVSYIPSDFTCSEEYMYCYRSEINGSMTQTITIGGKTVTAVTGPGNPGDDPGASSIQAFENEMSISTYTTASELPQAIYMNYYFPDKYYISADPNKVTRPLNGSSAVFYIWGPGNTGYEQLNAFVGNGPVAVDEGTSSVGNAAVQIDLTAGANGFPTSAQLVGSPAGGTVTGFPGTTVTFTPAPGSTSAGSFSFILINPTGKSHVATATIWPGIVSTRTKSICASVGSSADEVSGAFDGAAIALDGPGKALIKNIGATVFTKVFTTLVAQNDEVFGQQEDLAIGTSAFLQDAFLHFDKTNPLSIAMEADSLIFGGLSMVANICAKDPPDPNYQTVALPQKLRTIKTGNKTVDQLETDYLKYLSLTVASVHAAERWQGATLANASTYQSLQSTAFTDYSEQASAALTVLNADNATLSNTLSSVDINLYPGGAQAIATAFNAQCGKPLPAALNAALLSLKVSQQAINSAVCNYVHTVTTASITSDFKTALSVPLP